LNFRDIPAKKLAVLQLNMIGRFAVNVVVSYNNLVPRAFLIDCLRPNGKCDSVM